ncbi:beta-Ala-His dipeptidase [Sinocyclocheilus rhinocerous]|uniref:beta-Ala-His dipeptidase n=1 Tax=Sinocyclocheilus rhinocerous TaxID=307959 RepID=UPI0007BA20A8|nr:PREDICTED: beta-Ala-His dipeptidase-like [Sinocyclocheilus rhinocerous]
MMNSITLVCLLLCTGVSSFRFEELTQYVNSHEEEFIETLRQWIAVESDSSDVTKRPDLHRMMDMTAEKLRLVGGSVEMVDVGTQALPNGSSLALPKVVTARFGEDPSKRTVCVYGHVDVQPAKKEDGWATDPYELTDIDGNLYGRGASDNKAPVLAWIHTVEVYKALNIDLPVNVKFIIEGMEETGSNGLDDMIVAQKDSFFSDVDYIIISDCVWLSRRPALTYGTRGNCYFFAEVEGPKKDLHSGVYGGTVMEPMTDLISILGADLLRQLKTLHISSETHGNTCFSPSWLHQVDLLAHRWRHPTVSIHGIEGAFSSPGTKTVIPAKVIAKFSIRQVPNMDPAVVEKQVTDYLHSVFAKRKSPNKLNITMVIGAKPWLADPKHPLYEAGKAAVKRVFAVEPDLIREGGTIPIARTFQDVTGKSIIMLPIGGFDDGLHSQNEKISRYNYMEGTKLFIAYLHEVSQIKKY